MKCEREACTREATHMPVLCVPATGWPKGSHEPMQMFCGVKLCKFHANEFRVDPLAEGNEKMREVMVEMARAMEKVKPDFRRSWMEFRRLESVEVKKFLEMRKSEGGSENADA